MANDRKSEIRATLDGMIDALNAADRDRLGTFLSHTGSGIHIGTDQTEWLTNEQLVDALAGGEVSGVQVVVEDWSIHSLGADTAWAAGLAHLDDGTRQSAPVRLSAVLSYERGHWVVAHSHASIGVPNDELFEERSGRS